MVAGRVALTGATGFIGRHLVDCLTARDIPVTVLARRRDAADQLDIDDVIIGDLENKDTLAELCREADSVIHCAGIISAKSRAAYDRVNVTATGDLVKAARSSNAKRFILISSMAAREPGISDYCASKRAGETEMRRLIGDMDWSILRPPAVYGPGDRGTLPLIKQFTRKTAYLPGHPRNRFSLINALDLARAITAMLDDDFQMGGIHEIHDGCENGYSWNDLAIAATRTTAQHTKCRFLPRSIADLAGFGGLFWAGVAGGQPFATPGKIRELYHRDWVARHNLLDAHAQWTPEIRFEQGFADTLAWYRKEGWL